MPIKILQEPYTKTFDRIEEYNMYLIKSNKVL